MGEGSGGVKWMDDWFLGRRRKGSTDLLSSTVGPHDLGEIPGLGSGEGGSSEGSARHRQSTLGSRRISHASLMHQQKLQQYMQKHLENQMIEWKLQHEGGTFIEYIQEVAICIHSMHNYIVPFCGY